MSNIQSLQLPNNWKIETFGKIHIAGGFMHLIDPEGEIHTRLLANDFAEHPERSARALMGMFGESIPNIGSRNCPTYEVKSVYL